ncbi:CG34448, partial [Drosophila busckii]
LDMFDLLCLLLLLGRHTLGQQLLPLELCLFADVQCPNQRISFWLYNNATVEKPVQLDALHPEPSLFEPRQPLKILIHGFVGHRNATPNLELRPLLLQTQPVHVISVDYSSLVRLPCYLPWAVQNNPTVAKCVAQLINSLLVAHIYTAQQIHLIGFSLGAQVAGLVANHVHAPLARITALDPAGNGFHGNTPAGQLDRGDAHFIDVLHTDPFLFSMLPMAIGHADFYVNLELFGQPGCNPAQLSCNHFRAGAYYAESIVSARGFWAQPCGDWLQYLTQRCSQYSERDYVLMGYFVPENASGSYFVSTNAQSPYAKGPPIDVAFDVAEKVN